MSVAFSVKQNEREIFWYSDGTNERGIDPLRAYRLLATHAEFNLEQDTQAAESGDQNASTRLLKAFREIFELSPWKKEGDVQTGVTDGEVFELAAAFADYLDSVKKNTSPSPTSPADTEQEPLSSSLESTSQTSDTSASSDSTSTSDAPTTAAAPTT